MNNEIPYSTFQLWLWGDFLPHSLNGKPIEFATLNEIFKAAETDPMLLEAVAARVQKRRVGTSLDDITAFCIKEQFSKGGSQ